MSLTEIANELYQRRGAFFQIAAGLMKGYAGFEIFRNFLGAENMSNAHGFAETAKFWGMFVINTYFTSSSAVDLMMGTLRARHIPAEPNHILAPDRYQIVETQAYTLVRNRDKER